MRTTLAAVIGMLLPFVATTCQEIPWHAITIESRHAGLEMSRDQSLVIEFKDGVILARKQKVSPQLVNELISSLNSQAVTVPTLGSLGITEAWLKENVPTLLEGTPNQKSLFQGSFTDSKTATELLPYAFRFVKDDDYPQIIVTVTLRDGGRWVCSSKSYYPFMLPWKLNRGGSEESTYNANISRALASLMPKGSLNRNRLTDEPFKEWLSDEVMRHIKSQWDLKGVEDRAPESFAVLRRSFEVESARIGWNRSVDFGFIGNEKGPHEENLQVVVRQPTLPANVAEDVVLLYRNGKIEGVGELAARIEPYVTLALSVPWLSEYRANHPEQKMYIRFVHDRSVSDKAMQNLAADMEQIGKGALADEVKLVQNDAAFVFLDYGSDWIVLPDKRMILWRHYRPASFLKWSESDFPFKRCADYNAYGGGCVGMMVSADGVLEK
jgi:hypothetical protein